MVFWMHAQIVESFFFNEHMYYVSTYSSNLEIKWFNFDGILTA